MLFRSLGATTRSCADRRSTRILPMSLDDAKTGNKLNDRRDPVRAQPSNVAMAKVSEEGEVDDSVMRLYFCVAV